MGIRQAMFRNASLFRRVMSLYPPFLGAGVRVRSVSADFREVVVDLHSNSLNRNAFGTHFGGSLYAMTDPFYALMLTANLGPDHVVWDKAAQIDFVKPGHGTVSARFVLTAQQIEEARSATANGAKFEPVYPVEVRDAQDVLVARVAKTLYVRRKREA
jgi:acyl-coenzyme A thioesterase PaaI-like protein